MIVQNNKIKVQAITIDKNIHFMFNFIVSYKKGGLGMFFS